MTQKSTKLVLLMITICFVFIVVYLIFNAKQDNTIVRPSDILREQPVTSIANEHSTKNAVSVKDKTNGNVVIPEKNEFRKFVDDVESEVLAEAKYQEKVLDVKARTPVIKWQKQRVENIKKENIKEIIENLANFDDNQFAMTAKSDGYIPGEPFDEIFRMVHLARVGRLFVTGKKDPNSVVPLLKDTLKNIYENWPRVLEQRQIESLKHRHTHGWIKEGPDEYDKYSTQAIAATYLLAELNDIESLELMFSGFKRQVIWIEQYKPYPDLQYPVPPAIILYAMHRLILNYPSAELSEQALKMREDYLKWAEDNLPEPKIISRSVWDAEYDTSDLLVKITDPEGVLHKSQRKIEMVLYPHKFKDGPWFQGYIEDKVDSRTQQWFDTMQPFLKSVVPENSTADSNSDTINKK